MMCFLDRMYQESNVVASSKVKMDLSWPTPRTDCMILRSFGLNWNKSFRFMNAVMMLFAAATRGTGLASLIGLGGASVVPILP